MSVTPVDHLGHVAVPPQARPTFNMHRDSTAKKYLQHMEKAGELLPGSTEPILKRLNGLIPRVAQPTGNGPLDRLVRAVAFLESPGGKLFANPEHQADANEPALKSTLRRLDVPPKTAARLYDDLAVGTAGRSGLTLLAPVFSALDTDRHRHLLGAEKLDPVPPGAARPPKPVGL
jgi:hypothetical protein